MDDVEALGEFDEGDVVVEIAGAATANSIVHRRRARHQPERDPVAAHLEASQWVPRRHREVLGNRTQRMRDDLAWDPDEPGVLTDDRPDRSESCPSRGAHELDTDLLQQIERRFVHRMELVFIEKLDVADRIPGGGPVKSDGAARAALRAARSPRDRRPRAGSSRPESATTRSTISAAAARTDRALRCRFR